MDVDELEVGVLDESAGMLVGGVPNAQLPHLLLTSLHPSFMSLVSEKRTKVELVRKSTEP